MLFWIGGIEKDACFVRVGSVKFKLIPGGFTFFPGFAFSRVVDVHSGASNCG